MTGHRYLRMIPYAARQWRALGLTIALTAALSAITALEPWPLKLLVDYALGAAALPHFLRSAFQGLSLRPTPVVLVVAAALSSLVLFAVRAGIDAALTLAWTAASQRMVYDLAADLFQRLQRLSLLFHARRPVGDAVSRLTDDAWCVCLATEGLLVSPWQRLVTLVIITVVSYRLDSVLATASLAMAPLLAASALYFGDKLKHRARMQRENRSRLLSFVLQTLTSIPVVQAFGSETRNRLHFRNLAEEAVDLSQRASLLHSAYGMVNGVTFVLGTAAVFYLGGRRALSGALSFGSLVVFLSYMRTMQSAWQALLQNYAAMKGVQASIDRVLEIFDAGPEVRQAPGARSLTVTGHVRLESVTFGYELGRPVLNGVALEARPGETVALVGPTGAGKTTLASLIPRFFDPWEGRVLIDGADARQVRLFDLRSQVGLVLQEPFLMPLSVAENIAYGRPRASRAQIEAAAEAANAIEFVRRLPDGFDTVIGQRGATLSGGEKQRLAIARALLKDAPILILDEPTSALDSQTESSLLEALQRLMTGRTTFIIAHRLSTIRQADRIVVIEDGRIIEEGTHPELLANVGPYYRFHALQAWQPGPEVLA